VSLSSAVELVVEAVFVDRLHHLALVVFLVGFLALQQAQHVQRFELAPDGVPWPSDTAGGFVLRSPLAAMTECAVSHAVVTAPTTTRRPVHVSVAPPLAGQARRRWLQLAAQRSRPLDYCTAHSCAPSWTPGTRAPTA